RHRDPDGGSLLQDCGGRFQWQTVGLANDVSELSPDQWKDVFAWPAEAKRDDASPTPERNSTNLTPPLERALKKSAEGGGAVRGVILISDGRQNKGDVPTDLAERLGQRKATLFPVVVGSAAERPGVTVASVMAPRTILKDPEDAQNLNVIIKSQVRVRSVEAQTLLVELFDGNKMLDRKPVKHPGGDFDHEVVF